MEADPVKLLDPLLLEQETAALRALARRLVGDPEVAEDLVQDVWQAGLSGNADRVSPAWRRGVLRNLSLRWIRDLGRRRRGLARVGTLLHEI